MLRTVPRVLAAMGVVAAAATTSACGADRTQACDNIEQEIQSLGREAAQQIEDPQALATTVRDSATRIREEGEPVGGEVAQATEEAATALTQMADRLAEGSMQRSDLTAILNADRKIDEACV